MALTPFDMVCAARMGVYRKLPYFMKMLFKLEPVEQPGCGTFFVDEKLRVHYDPEMVAKWGSDACATFLAHEVQHPLREHIARGKRFIDERGARWRAARPWLAKMHPMLGTSVPFFWNVVADLEINPVVIEAGFAFPEGFKPVFPATFGLKADSRFAEEYATELFERAEKMKRDEEEAARNAPKPQPQDDEDDDDEDAATPPGMQMPTPETEDDDEPQDESSADADEHRDESGGGDEPDDAGDVADADEDSDDDSADAEGAEDDGADAESSDDDEQTTRPLEGCCGGCAANRNKFEGDVAEEDMPSGASETSVDIARRQVAHDTQEPTREMMEVMKKHGVGNVPGSLKRWADAQLAPPEVKWQNVLAPLVRNAIAYARGRMDWKYGKPSRRREVLKQSMGEQAPILPSLTSPVPNVGIVVDMSGSMQSRGTSGRTMMDEALSEVVGIVVATGSPCWTAAVDAQVQTWVRVTNKTDVPKLIAGCGGTDMRVGIAAAAEKRFDVIVLITDGYTPWPTEQEMPRRSRLVVCCTTDVNIPDHIRPVVRVTPKTKKETQPCSNA